MTPKCSARSTSYLLAILAALASGDSAQGDAPARPSIVVFLADDLGWAE
ncbi:hypothetical protein [Paludisphaera sp.]